MPTGYVTKNFIKLETAFQKGYTSASLQGSARCFGRGTLVRMADGRLKAVENVVVGDKLMNKEGNGYNAVTEVHSGIDRLYRVRQARGIDYVVNSRHILALRQSQAKAHKVAIPGYKSAEKRRIEYLPYDHEKIYDFDITWYINQSGNFQRLYSGFKNTMVQLPEKPLLIDPYYLGVWLGDRTTKQYYSLSNTDKGIIEYFYNFAKSLETYAYLREAFKYYNLIDNKHVPDCYIYNSYENRLKLLAGLLDTDGCKSGRNTISFCQKRKQIVEAVEEICRLSGFYTNGMREEKATMRRADGSMYETTVYAIEINHADFNDLNKYMKVERKKIKGKHCERNYFSTSISIEDAGVGEYFGFTLDNSPYFLLQDGTVAHNSSKTYSIVQWLVHRCISTPNTTVSIVRNTLPAVKRSVFRDFLQIINDWGVYNPKNLNKSELIYYFDNGSWIEFFSCENEQKLRGPKRQILYVNEANEISYLEWQQLQMRTTVFSILDYNPSFSEEHWINQVNQERKTCFWVSTYKDNPFLEQRIIDEIESLQWKNPSLWQVYGLGQRAMVEGLVFPKFEIVSYMPTGTMQHRFGGQDLGYSSDPSAGVEVRIYGKDLYINELFYRTQMLTNDLIKEWKKLDWSPKIISESADPRLIDELYNAGLDIWPVHKYAGSIQAGIMKMQEFNIKITKQSINVIKEFRNYTYRQDKEGKWLDQPIDSFNHCVTGGTLVQTIDGAKRIVDIKVGDLVLTRRGYRKVTKFFDNGMRQVVYSKIVTDLGVYEIGATFEHLFNANGKWKKYVELTKTDSLFVLSFSTVLNTEDTQVANIPTIITTNGKHKAYAIRLCCITPFMNTIMVKYRKAVLSITKISILLTTTLATLWRLLRQSILLSIKTFKNGIKNMEIFSVNEDSTKKTGIHVVQSLTEILHKVCVFAKTVGKSLHQRMSTNGFAATLATTNGSTNRPPILCQQSANIAEKNSCTTNTLNKSVAQKSARINYCGIKGIQWLGDKEEHVYDIEVDGEHEFFANGILVHNCIDAVRYVVLEEVLGANSSGMSSAQILGLTDE